MIKNYLINVARYLKETFIIMTVMAISTTAWAAPPIQDTTDTVKSGPGYVPPLTWECDICDGESEHEHGAVSCAMRTDDDRLVKYDETRDIWIYEDTGEEYTEDF